VAAAQPNAQAQPGIHHPQGYNFRIPCTWTSPSGVVVNCGSKDKQKSQHESSKKHEKFLAEVARLQGLVVPEQPVILQQGFQNDDPLEELNFVAVVRDESDSDDNDDEDDEDEEAEEVAAQLVLSPNGCFFPCARFSRSSLTPVAAGSGDRRSPSTTPLRRQRVAGGKPPITQRTLLLLVTFVCCRWWCSRCPPVELQQFTAHDLATIESQSRIIITHSSSAFSGGGS
jgi:hypothetical protein